MKAKRRWWALALVTALLPACNYDDGQCWLPSEDGQGGQAGGPLVPTGAGGFGDVSPKPQNASGPNPPSCVQVGTYSSSLFNFTTVVADDGQGVAGGYQQATASGVKFVDGRQDPPAAWTCNVTVRMPIRTAKYGKISPSDAADIAATVLTDAASPTMHSQPSWQPTLFCKKLQDNMNTIFFEDYNGLGGQASVNR